MTPIDKSRLHIYATMAYNRLENFGKNILLKDYIFQIRAADIDPILITTWRVNGKF